MITGRFDDDLGRPIVAARFTLMGQHIDDTVEFLVDTGADITMLSASDAALLFDDPERGLCSYLVEAAIMTQDEGNEDTPSLLGRDVLDRLRLVYDRLEDELLLDLKAPDLVV